MNSHIKKKILFTLIVLSPGFIVDPVDCWADFLVSENLGESAYSASNQYQNFAPENAFDGSFGTLWNSGSFATEWIEVDLQDDFIVSRFELHVRQTPNSNTIHEFWVSDDSMQNDLSSATLAHTLSGFTTNGQVLAFSLDSPLAARHVQIRTTQSSSWVAWGEVQVFAVEPIPEPTGLIPVLFGSLWMLSAARVRAAS